MNVVCIHFWRVKKLARSPMGDVIQDFTLEWIKNYKFYHAGDE